MVTKGVKEGGWNNLTIELENGVRILASSTSSNSIVGFTINLLYIDEVSKLLIMYLMNFMHLCTNNFIW